MDGGCLLGIVGGMVAEGSSQLFSALSLLWVWLVAVGVGSGWAPQGRREQKGGCAWEHEAGEMCAAAGFSCEWPGVGGRLRGHVLVVSKRGRFNFFSRPFFLFPHGCSCEEQEGAAAKRRLRLQVPGRIEKGGFSLFTAVSVFG